MVDQNSIFGGMLTTLGAAKKTNCDALGIPWEPRYMLIGDANGTDPVPSPAQTKLINQRYRAQLNQLRVSPTDDNVLIAELVLPPDVGGWWIRELALEDKDGVFSAVANVAPSYKPLLAQGSGRNQVVRMHVITSGTSNIQLKIDPSVVLATREYVDTKIFEELYKLDCKQSVRVATTANIALTGLQTIDGVALAASDRVLVKNQTLAKDNGIYVVPTTGAWARAADADSNAEVTSALLVSVEQGATLADTRWQLITDGTIVLGTTALTFQNVTQGFAPINAPALVNPTANTQPQFDNSSKLATTEFVQRSLGSLAGVSVYSGSTVLPLSDVGKYITINGAATVTLPATSTLPVGSKFAIAASTTGAVAVVVAGGGTIAGANNTPSGPTIVLAAGVMMEFIVFGNGIYSAVGGSGASSLGANGYQKFPSGLIEQWGTLTVNDNAEQAISLPVAFPNAVLGVIATSSYSLLAGAGEFAIAGARKIAGSLSTIAINANTGPTVSSAQVVTWRAWGY
ncbi:MULTISPECIES: phage tail protein [Pseudomonas]|uniref:phage tail protein n=1 Tax=Pseudomonas TaxID=286 RepID=UPI00107073F5|nr:MULTISPECIES: phage tail protein [Pseudomonas]QBR32942.1 phage tail protein [Pseudomonas sp. S150]UZT91127.1 phage tail protein [Pseudomonas koreensis]